MSGMTKGTLPSVVQNMNEALLGAMDAYAARTCFRVWRHGRYRDISYREFQRLAFRLVSFYRHYGLVEGERVVIIADNCLEWMVAYVACLLCGGIPVPLPTSLRPDMTRFIVQDAGARLVVLHDDRQSRILDDMLKELPELETVLAVNQQSLPGAFVMSSVLARAISSQEEEELRAEAEHIKPQAIASIFYTAGKTADPRGAVFDHAQRLQGMRHLGEWMPLNDRDLAFTFAPWSYLPSLDVSLHYFLSGVTNVVAQSRQTIYDNVQQASPTVGLVTPYFIEQLYHLVADRIGQLPEASRKAFSWALATSKEYYAANPMTSQEVSERYARADLTFFSQIRGWLGGRLQRLYSAGAPLSQELADFLRAIGLVVLDTYSIVEAGGFPAICKPDGRKEKSCGRVAPGFQVRIAEDGEVLVRGETIMREYWRQPEDTIKALDPDGWLHTGDLGSFDQDGYLYLTGRKRSLIVLSTGRKVVPRTIERALVASPLVDQAIVLGNGRPYITALIVPNMQAVVSLLSESGTRTAAMVSLTTSASLRKWLDAVVTEVNDQLTRWERVRGYTILDQLQVKTTDELTTVTSIDRQEIAEQYAAEIEAMYPTAAHLADRVVTKVQVEPEHLRELLEKQDILETWMDDAGIGFLIDLARAKGIDAPSMVSISDTAVAVAQMQSEEKPLSTALVVGDPAHIAQVLPHSEIQLQRYDRIRRMRPVVVTLAKVVDGLALGFAVDKHGYVRGIHKLGVALEESDTLLLGPWFRRHAAISRHCDALVFFVPPGGRQVRVFADGRPAGRYAGGRWSPESMASADKAVARLAEQKKCELALLQQVVRCAFQMSEQNLGAMFILGEADTILKRSDPPQISAYAAIANTDMARLTDRELVNFAKQDGATVIDIRGEFRGCMVFVRPAAGTEAEIGLGKGARHSSAAKISAEAGCLVITVSQDGPITVYDCGQRVLSL